MHKNAFTSLYKNALVHKYKNALVPLYLYASLFVAGMATSYGLFYYGMVDCTHYAYVDVAKVVQAVHLQLKDVPDAELAVRTQRAKEAFDRALKRYTKKHRAIIYSTTKVIAGATDITDQMMMEVGS